VLQAILAYDTMELRFASDMEEKTYLQVCRAEVAEELQRGIDVFPIAEP
jgi:hypothetical protein